MEPEHAVRTEAQGRFEVHIRYGRRRLHSAYGNEPSATGLRLEVQAVTLPDGTPVQLEIRAGGHAWLVPAVVSRRDGRSIRVTFLEPQPELAADLQQAACLPPPLPRPRSRLPLLDRTAR